MRVSLMVAMCPLLASLAFAQDKKQPPAKAPHNQKRNVGVKTPPLKPLAAPQLFAAAFEHYRQGRYEDAEELFIAGLKRDDKDYRAWEWLARSQAEQNKETQAERSLQEAVKRGLPKESEEKAKEELATLLPDKWSPAALECLSPEADQALRQIRVPRAGPKFELKYTHAALNTIWRSEVEVAPKRGVLETSLKPGDFRTQQARHPWKQVSFLGGLVTCQAGDWRISQFRTSDRIFPLRVGDRFAYEYEFTLIPSMTRARDSVNCTVGEKSPATTAELPGHPEKGDLTRVSCLSRSAGSVNKFDLIYSSFLRAFVPAPQSGQHYLVKPQ